jgi:hypothetical protein
VEEEITTRRLTLVDENGKRRIEMNADDDGGTIFMFDRNDNARLMITIDDDTQGLVFMDEDQQQKITFGVFSEGGTKLIFTDEDISPRVVLAYNENSAQAALFGENKEVLWGRPGLVPGEMSAEDNDDEVATTGIAAELLGIVELLEKGHITAEQFEKIKSSLLGEL